jgi:hypothetical protein
MRTLPFEGVAALTGSLVAGTAVGRGVVVAAGWLVGAIVLTVAALVCEGATVGLAGELQLANATIKTQADVTINFDR